MPAPLSSVPASPPDESELIRQSGVALRVGRLSLSAGTGSYRVKASMSRVARALGIERHEAHVTLTEITATSHRGDRFRTEVAEVRTIGIDAARLSELELLASRLERAGRTVTTDEVTAELDRIEAARPLYPLPLNALWAALACAAFAFLTGGGPLEMVGAFLGAWAGQAVRRALLHRRYNVFGVTMLAATAGGLAYLGFVSALQAVGAASGGHEAGMIAAVLFLVPGFPLVTGALDLAKLDFSAGVARLTYALMVLSSAALAMWGLTAAAGVSTEPEAPWAVGAGVLLAARLAASFVAVLGFALMFNSPLRMALGAAVVGMVANVVRLELVDAGAVPQAAAVAAALLVGVLAAGVAPRLRVPRITISVPAVVIMVPGVTAYRGVIALSDGSTTDALAFVAEAALVVVALAIGLAVARMLTDPAWAFER